MKMIAPRLLKAILKFCTTNKLFKKKTEKKVFSQSGCIRVEGVERDGRISVLVDFGLRFPPLSSEH